MVAELSASIDEVTAAAMGEALSEYATAMGGSCAKAVKVAALGVCDSLRAHTKKAPSVRPKREYRIFPAISAPHYITYKNGKRLARPLHRWSLTTKVGTPNEVTRQYFAYSTLRLGKKGNVVTDVAAEKAEIRRHHLGIRNHGLARASYGKIKAELASCGSDVVWNKRRNRRNPLDSVSGKFSASKDGAAALISNRLEYIESTISSSAVRESVAAAAKKLAFKAASARGMTPEEAADYARNLLASFA